MDIPIYMEGSCKMETGFKSNGGLVQYGKDNISNNWDYLIENNVPLRILISGDLPVDKDGVAMNCSFFSGTTPIFSATGTWGIQGSSSVSSLKKNWKLKLRNPNTGKKLQIKFADWFPMSSITLKGYGTDRTLLRDSLSTQLWRQMYSLRYDGLLACGDRYDYFKFKNYSSMTSALFSTAGFPVELYQNDAFLGMYVIRCDNNNDNFLMDGSNPAHIQMQPNAAWHLWESPNFNIADWEVYCPDTIADSTMNAGQKFMQWAYGCINGSIDMRSTYKNYIDLNSYLDYIILCESVVSFDSMTNNFNMATWNGTDTNPIWFIYPYDFDQSFGIAYGLGSIAATDPSKIGWVMRTEGNVANQSADFFETIAKTFWGELRERYYYLRSLNILDGKNLARTIKEQVNLMNPSSMQQDLLLWNADGPTGAGSGNFLSDNGKKWSFVFIKEYFEARLTWLDKQFNI